MVRALVGSALLLSALGLASAFVGPSLSGSPGGEPMVVGGAEIAALHEASFEVDCFPTLLLDSARSPAAAAENRSALALTFRKGPDGVTIGAGKVATGDAVAGDTFIVILDSGQVRAPGFARTQMEPVPVSDCPGLDADRPGLI